MVRKVSERGRIDVIVRKRPLNELEMSKGEKDIVICNYDSGTIREFKCKIDGTNFIEEHEFKVDRFYDEKADNELIYNEYVKPLVECAFREKKTCSCFTYGQTGSGKTYTMIGSRIPKRYSDSENKVVGKMKIKILIYLAGIYEYAANDIYRILKEPEFEGKIDVVISFYEIYCGKLYDLLQNRKLLESLDNGKKEVVIRDLSVRTVTSKEDLVEHMLEGLNLRKIGQNSQNDHSSRSHALLRIELRNKENGKFQGGIIFIDLAGSERGADSINMCKQIQIDGAGINRSLLALKECIRAMDMDRIHIPFRNSELTKVLRDVFMGGSRNVMIANICPSFQSCEQTLNTLRYASRVKNFKSNSNNNGSNNNTNSLSSYDTFDSVITDTNSSKTYGTSNNSSNSNNNNRRNIDTGDNTNNNGSNNNTNSYSRFVSLPVTKYNSYKYMQYSKSPTSKFVKDIKRTSPRSSNSSLDSGTKINFDNTVSVDNIDMMDADVIDVDQYVSTLDTEMYSSSPSLILEDLNSSRSSNNSNKSENNNKGNRTKYIKKENTIKDNKEDNNNRINTDKGIQENNNKEKENDSSNIKQNNNRKETRSNNKDSNSLKIVDNILKSQIKSIMNNINLILESLELNDFYSDVYNITSNKRIDEDEEEEQENKNKDNKYEENKKYSDKHNSNNLVVPVKGLDRDEVLKVYDLYSKVSSIIKSLTTSEDPIEDINNKFKMELKILLYLGQILDKQYC